MAAADKKSTYTAAEVAELIRPLEDSIALLQKENAELKRKLEHMNEVFANAQRARFGQSSEKNSYELHALQTIKIFFKDFNWSSVLIHQLMF